MNIVKVITNLSSWTVALATELPKLIHLDHCIQICIIQTNTGWHESGAILDLNYMQYEYVSL